MHWGPKERDCCAIPLAVQVALIPRNQTDSEAWLAAKVFQADQKGGRGAGEEGQKPSRLKQESPTSHVCNSKTPNPKQLRAGVQEAHRSKPLGRRRVDGTRATLGPVGGGRRESLEGGPSAA